MSTNNQQRFNDDGTPRRRYELEQTREASPVVGAAIGLVLVNAAILLKNILFPAHAAQAMPTLQSAPAEARVGFDEPSGIGREASDDSQPGEPLSNGGANGDHHQGRTAMRLVSINIAPLASGEDPIHRAAIATSHLAGNDNRALYGAAPGHGVTLPANDAIHIPTSGGRSGDGHVVHSNASVVDGEFVPGEKAPGPVLHPATHPAPSRLENTAPVVSTPASLGNRFINQAIVIGLADFIANATDADGDRLTVTEVTPSSGTITANRDGTWSYMPEQGSIGEVTSSYAVSDGQHATPAMATLTLAMPADAAGSALQQAPLERIGSGAPVTDIRDGFVAPVAEKIVLSPSAQPHAIEGTSGHDVIAGTMGSDIIHAGLGNDVITAGAGDDMAYGEGGNDTFIATMNDGNDTYDGGEGQDTLDLTAITTPPAIQQSVAATAPVSGHSADCVIDLNAGTATGGQIGNDVLASIENVKSGAGNDSITGDGLDNVLDGGAGADIVDGGAGDDTIIASADAADDDYYGGTGSDTYDASHIKADAIIDLLEGSADSILLGHDSLHDVENVISGSGNDVIVADDHANFFSGGAGDDTFVFHSANAIGFGEGNHDVILDFAVGDKIDISDIGKEFSAALADVYQDQAIKEFVFINNADIFSKPGELKLLYSDASDTTVLLGNIDFSANAEFELEFKGHVTLTESDFHHH